MTSNSSPAAVLSNAHKAIIPIAAFAAAGDMSRLHTALEHGLDAGVSINAIKEVLVQVYAYAGFPRSLNALGLFMKVTETRHERGIVDQIGPLPSQPAPQGPALLEAGTRNQTELVGAPVAGPLFVFAPAADTFLKTHLFGDIFARDNLDWQAREIATISMLSALEGVGSQLQSHLKISMNVGISESQLREFVAVLAGSVGKGAADRADAALSQMLSH